MALAAWTRHPTGRPEVQGPGSGDADPAATAPEHGGAGSGAGSGGAARATQPCAEAADCYPEAFCASDQSCHSVQPGAPGKGCKHAALAAPRDTSGPVIFDIVQDVIGTNGDLCRKDRSCLNDGNVCHFSPGLRPRR